MSEQITPTKKYTCTCDAPCSGSITCETGCYAFCEENPEGSERYICIKGCASEILDEVPEGRLQRTARFASVDLKMPARYAVPLLERLFGIELPDVKLNADAEISVCLKDVTLDAILRELQK